MLLAAPALLPRPRAGDIGPVRREIIFEPLPETPPVHEPAPVPAPAAPAREPAEAPA